MMYIIDTWAAIVIKNNGYAANQFWRLLSNQKVRKLHSVHGAAYRIYAEFCINTESWDTGSGSLEHAEDYQCAEEY
jgi:hypothetical protein